MNQITNINNDTERFQRNLDETKKRFPDIIFTNIKETLNNIHSPNNEEPEEPKDSKNPFNSGPEYNDISLKYNYLI